MKAAGRYSVPLVALGAGTDLHPQGGGILVHFDLMRGLRLPEREEPWVGPGRGRRGCNWTTSCAHEDGASCRLPKAPLRTTVGGWLPQDEAWA